MKKYIWVSLYFVWIVLLSYAFFYSSWKWEQLKNQDFSVEVKESWNVQKTVAKQNQDNNILKANKLTYSENTWDKLNNIKIKPVLEEEKAIVLTWDKAEKFTQMQEDSQTKKNDVKKEIIVWKIKLSYVNDVPYVDIYELLWYADGNFYQVPWKNIYLKQLKSVDYEKEKNNISQLIQKGLGNIKETNLFGDRQMFVNLDAYFKKVVIMLVSYNGKLYLVTLPYDKYYIYKSYLASDLFAKK